MNNNVFLIYWMLSFVYELSPLTYSELRHSIPGNLPQFPPDGCASCGGEKVVKCPKFMEFL